MHYEGQAAPVDITPAVSGKSDQLTTYRASTDNVDICRSFTIRYFRIYDADPTGRGISLHPTAVHFAVCDTFNPTVSAVLLTLSQDAGVDINATLSVNKITTNRADQTLIL